MAWHTGAMNHKPLLILLHGTCLNGDQWALYRDLLADVAEIAAPDLPGHGVHAHQPFSLDAAVQSIHALVRQAQARQQPVILGGHSLGGFVAMSYAERHPDQLAGLILIGSATEPGGPGAFIYRAVAQLWEMAGPQRVQQLHEHTLGRMADARVWAAVQARGESFGAVQEAWTQVMQHCGSRQLQQVHCPVLVLGGQLDQLHLQASRFAAAAPHGQVITAPQRTHHWPLTHPEEVAAHIATFVQRCLTSG